MRKLRRVRLRQTDFSRGLREFAPRYSRRGSKLSAESEPVKAGRACAWSTKAEMKTTEHHVVESSGDPSRIVPFPSPVSRPYDLLCFVLYGRRQLGDRADHEGPASA